MLCRNLKREVLTSRTEGSHGARTALGSPRVQVIGTCVGLRTHEGGWRETVTLAISTHQTLLCFISQTSFEKKRRVNWHKEADLGTLAPLGTTGALVEAHTAVWGRIGLNRGKQQIEYFWPPELIWFFKLETSFEKKVSAQTRRPTPIHMAEKYVTVHVTSTPKTLVWGPNT